MTIERILVGVDGSDDSRLALEWAGALASATGAEVVAVHAVGLLEHLRREMPVPAQSHRDQIRGLFEGKWCAALDAAGVRSRRLLRDGPPVLALRAAADEVGADLVVVGQRGVGGFPDLLLGSTSAQLAQHCRRPLTIVPSAS